MMQLARTWSRDAELAVRSALGATRSQVVRQLLTESALLALPGGLLGATLAWWGARFIGRVGAANIPRLAELRMEASTLGAILLVAVASALAFGTMSAFAAARTGTAAMQRGSRVAGRDSLRAVRLVGAMELALAFVLVFVAGLLAKSYARVLGVDPGYDPHRVLTVSLLPDGAEYDTQPRRLAYFDAVVERIRAIPGVVDAGYASTLPLSNPAGRAVYVREHARAADADRSRFDVYLVSGRYPDVMRIPLRRGRGFIASDVATTAPVALVSESAGRRLFGGKDPIGGHLQIDRRDDRRPWATVVGVVGDIHQSALDRGADAAVYLLFSQTMPAQGFARLAIRSAVPTERIESAVRDAMMAVDPRQPVFHMQPLSAYVALSLAERTFMLAVLAAFAALALLLALGGVYGLMSYQVEQRTREVGIRFALGATPANVVRMIVTQVLTTAAAALAAGGIVAALIARGLSVFLFGVAPLDGETLSAVAALIVIVALAASALPVRRLGRVDPAAAIRADG
jgi:putative ABC transport system permease protein